jgi:hypothetical protein
MIEWQAGTGSNRGPADLESAALPTELPTYDEPWLNKLTSLGQEWHPNE